MRVCHITTVHPPYDVRIFHKECVSLARAGYDVTLLVANGPTKTRDGVRIIGVPVEWSGRRQRIQRAPKALLQKAIELDAAVYHFHDPEFVRQGKKLAEMGKHVIYDVHEDVPKQIMAKYWIPVMARKFLSLTFKGIEERAAPKFSAILTAVEPISDRLRKFNANTLEIKNYPLIGGVNPLPDFSTRERSAVYVGSITKVRGILEMIRAVEICEVPLEIGGYFSPAELEQEAAMEKGWKHCNFLGMLDQSEVRDVLAKSRVGLVTLHKTLNYVEALPVKLFEYMLAGLPVVISDAPLWKSIVEEHDCGLAVDPMNPEAIAEAITFLLDNPERAQQMGENGRNAVLESLNWKIEEAKLLEVYARLSVTAAR